MWTELPVTAASVRGNTAFSLMGGGVINLPFNLGFLMTSLSVTRPDRATDELVMFGVTCPRFQDSQVALTGGWPLAGLLQPATIDCLVDQSGVPVNAPQPGIDSGIAFANDYIGYIVSDPSGDFRVEAEADVAGSAPSISLTAIPATHSDIYGVTTQKYLSLAYGAPNTVAPGTTTINTTYGDPVVTRLQDGRWLMALARYRVVGALLRDTYHTAGTQAIGDIVGYIAPADDPTFTGAGSAAIVSPLLLANSLHAYTTDGRVWFSVPGLTQARGTVYLYCVRDTSNLTAAPTSVDGIPADTGAYTTVEPTIYLKTFPAASFTTLPTDATVEDEWESAAPDATGHLAAEIQGTYVGPIEVYVYGGVGTTTLTELRTYFQATQGGVVYQPRLADPDPLSCNARPSLFFSVIEPDPSTGATFRGDVMGYDSEAVYGYKGYGVWHAAPMDPATDWTPYTVVDRFGVATVSTFVPTLGQHFLLRYSRAVGSTTPDLLAKSDQYHYYIDPAACLMTRTCRVAFGAKTTEANVDLDELATMQVVEGSLRGACLSAANMLLWDPVADSEDGRDLPEDSPARLGRGSRFFPEGKPRVLRAADAPPLPGAGRAMASAPTVVEEPPPPLLTSYPPAPGWSAQIEPPACPYTGSFSDVTLTFPDVAPGDPATAGWCGPVLPTKKEPCGCG